MRTNPSVRGGLRILKQAGFALGGLMATRYMPGLLTLIPGFTTVLGAAGSYVGILGALASGVAIWWLSGTRYAPGLVKQHRNELLIGAGLGILEQVIARFAPSISGAGMGDTWVEETRPLADYVADGTDLGGYVPELGIDVEQADVDRLEQAGGAQLARGLRERAGRQLLALAEVRLLELAEDLVFTATMPGQKTKTILGVGA